MLVLDFEPAGRSHLTTATPQKNPKVQLALPTPGAQPAWVHLPFMVTALDAAAKPVNIVINITNNIKLSSSKKYPSPG